MSVSGSVHGSVFSCLLSGQGNVCVCVCLQPPHRGSGKSATKPVTAVSPWGRGHSGQMKGEEELFHFLCFLDHFNSSKKMYGIYH